MGKCRIKEQLNSQFALKDLGEAKSLLGIRIRRGNDKICLDQKNYIIETLYKFNIFDNSDSQASKYSLCCRNEANIRWSLISGAVRMLKLHFVMHQARHCLHRKLSK